MPMSPRRPATRLLTALILAGLAFAAGAQDDLRLPDLGSSANALISPQEAQDYGAAMLRQMRALDMVVDDPLLDDYINDLGYRLVASSDKPKEHFAFFIVKDPEINAFAAPGGYIAVNAGLMTITRDESELAGVVAHEIGHITQNHLQRAFEDSKKDAPLMALVLLGAIVAGAGSHSGDAPVAIAAAGQGLIAQKSINFTRKDEIEADRVGIQTLAKSGFDPNAMAAFFQRMQDVLSTGAGGDDVPALLQTHPVTTMRISDAKARAGALIAAQKLRPSGAVMDLQQWQQHTAPIAFVKDPISLMDAPRPGPLDTYNLMRERVRVLAGDATREATYYGSNLQTRPEFDTPANHYGYALALTRSGRADKAIQVLDPLLASHPDNLVLRLAMAGFHGQYGIAGGLLQLGDQAVDLPGGFGSALGQLAHFVGHHGKASAHFTGTCRFDGRVQRQQVGLVGDALDHIDHATNLVAVLGQLRHRLAGFAHRRRQALDGLAGFTGNLPALAGQAVGFLGGIGGALHVVGHFLSGGGHLVDRSGNLLGLHPLALQA